MIIIEIKNLFFKFSHEKYTLNNISVKIEKGEKIAVLGRNGSGKTTFFLCLNGVLKPYEGRILVNGEELKDKELSTSLRKITGVVFQETDSQFVAPTVYSEVSFGPMNMKLSETEVRQRTDFAVKEMNLTDMSNRNPHYLSGGEKRRVAIADILAMDPQIIILDEPTSGLDIINSEALDGTLKRLEEGEKTVIVSTHDVDFALKWADRVWIFDEGCIIADDKAEKILKDESLLIKSGLKSPTVYEVSRKLGIENPPKSINKLADFLKEIIKND